MRAGLLREFLIFQTQAKEQSDSGAIKIVWKDSFTCRAWKKRNSTGEEFSTKELFVSERLTFQTRYDVRITSDLRVRYNGVYYKIVGVPDRQISDNTLIIVITKENQ